MKLESSYIYIKGVRFRAYIGVSELERKVGNDYVADLCLRYSIQPAKLLEHTAYRIAEAIMKAFPDIEAIDLDLTKLNPPMGADCSGAGVELHLINEKTKR